MKGIAEAFVNITAACIVVLIGVAIGALSVVLTVAPFALGLVLIVWAWRWAWS